jgi:SAM-dependent methyltransferase
MAEPPVAFAGSIPEYYERHLRPVFFEPYARDLAGRAILQAGPHLELACGTGVLTRRLLEGLDADASLTATDLNPSMLAEARKRVAPDPRLAWSQADMMALPFEAGAFGTVACQFGFMFPPDKEAAFREARRVLREGGRLIFNVWASLEENPANGPVARALMAFFPGDPPAFLKVPFGFHDPALISRLLEAHGFSAIRIHPLVLDCRSASARGFATSFARGTPMANELQARGADFDKIEAAIAGELAAMGGESPFSCPMKALVVEAEAV